jgi:flagella synthesis protein FlgN
MPQQQEKYTVTAKTDIQQPLGTILDQEISVAYQLAQALDRENAAICSRDLPVLQQAIADKQAELQRLEELNRERGLLVESHGYGSGSEGMKACLQRCDDNAGLAVKWRQLLKIAEDCRHQNRMNHQLMELGSRHIQRALCILRGEDPDQNLYGPGGDNLVRHASRNLATA